MPEAIGDEKFKYVARALLIIYDYKLKNVNPTLSDILEHNMNRPLFYTHLKHNLERAGLVEFRVNPDRTITAHLTPKGEKLAKCLKECEGILKDAGVL